MSGSKFIHVAGHVPYINTESVNLIFSTYDKESNTFILEILCDSNLQNGKYEFKFDTREQWQTTRANILKQWTKWPNNDNDQAQDTTYKLTACKSHFTIYDTDRKDQPNANNANNNEGDNDVTEEDELKVTESLYVVDVIVKKIQSIELTDMLVITTMCGAQIAIHDPVYFKENNMQLFIEMLNCSTVVEC